MADEGVDNFHAVTDLVVSEGRPSLLVATRVTHLTSEKLLVHGSLAGIPVHVEEARKRMLIDTNASSSSTDSHLSAQLERLVLKVIEKVLKTPATLETITNAVLNNPKFIAPVAALISSKHSCLTTEQAIIVARCRLFVKFGAKSDHSVATQMP